MLKKYYLKDICITNLKRYDYLKGCYKANYIITINNDIIDFSNTKKEAMQKARTFIKERKKLDKYYKKQEKEMLF